MSDDALDGQDNFQFSMYRIGTLTKTLAFNVGEALTSVSEYYAGKDTLSKILFKTSQSRELECADDSDPTLLILKKDHNAASNMMITHVNQLSDGTVTTVEFVNQ